jgi:hypothetical protein
MGSRSRVTTSAFALAATVACMMPCEAARAQTASDRETARSLMDEAFAKREKGDRKGALERFEAADALMHVPTTGIETAREKVALGLLIEAREVLANVVRYPAKPGEPAPFGEARMQAQRLDDEVAARIPQLRIVLRGVDGPASVRVDSVDVPPATLIAPRRLNPGTHTVVAKSGGRERREQITLRERETKELLIDLGGGAPAAAAAPAPPPSSSPEPSTPSEPDKKSSDGTSGIEPPVILFWGGIGLAGVGVLVGTITGAMSLSAVSTAKSGCVDSKFCPPATYDDIDRARSLGNVSTVSFVLAGLGAGAAVAGYFWGKSEGKQPSVGLLLGPGAIAASGTF